MRDAGVGAAGLAGRRLNRHIELRRGALLFDGLQVLVHTAGLAMKSWEERVGESAAKT
jgi:hypothetical protein